MLALFAVAGIVIVGFLVLSNASGKAYACDSLLTPGPSAPVPTLTPSPSPTPTPSPTPSVTPSPTPSPTLGHAHAQRDPEPQPVTDPVAQPERVTIGLAQRLHVGRADTLDHPDPPTHPARGFPVADLGRTHILDTSTKIDYAYCPPGSGSHYNVTMSAPSSEPSTARTRSRTRVVRCTISSMATS